MKIVLKPNTGQALLEAIVAVGLVLVIATGLIAGTTFSLRVGSAGKLRSVASKYTQEGVEAVRILRDQSWLIFQGTYSGVPPAGKLWCIPKTGGWTSGTCVASQLLDGVYNRSARLVWDATQERVEATIFLTWNENGTMRQSQVITYFTDWK